MSRLTLLAVLAVLTLPACTSPLPTVAETSTSAPTTRPASSSSTSSSTLAPTTTTSVPEDRALMVIGDWGAGTEATDSIARAMQEAYRAQPYEAIVTTGDNYYKDDVTALFEPFTWTNDAGVDWWASWGNHDIVSGARGAGITATLGPSPFWVKHEWGPLDVVILDSNQVDNPDQLDFLEAALASDRPAIVVFHHPAYSCSKHGSTPGVVTSWVPLISGDGDVLLVLNGHDHNYQHFRAAGVEYVVTGGGGRKLYDLQSCPPGHPELISGFEAYHFVRLELSAESLTVSAIDETGTELDAFTITLP